MKEPYNFISFHIKGLIYSTTSSISNLLQNPIPANRTFTKSQKKKKHKKRKEKKKKEKEDPKVGHNQGHQKTTRLSIIRIESSDQPQVVKVLVATSRERFLHSSPPWNSPISHQTPATKLTTFLNAASASCNPPLSLEFRSDHKHHLPNKPQTL